MDIFSFNDDTKYCTLSELFFAEICGTLDKSEPASLTKTLGTTTIGYFTVIPLPRTKFGLTMR